MKRLTTTLFLATTISLLWIANGHGQEQGVFTAEGMVETFVEEFASSDDLASGDVALAAHESSHFRSEVIELANYVQRLEALEAELASLHSQVGKGGCGDCGGKGCKAGCLDCGHGYRGYRGTGCDGIVFEVEAFVAAYHRSDGSRVGSDAGENVEPGWDITPRVTAGYVAPSGLGVRGRFWYYNHTQRTSNNIPDESLHNESWTADLEMFDTFYANDCWSFELSGGFRWTSFDEHMRDFDEGELRFNYTRGGGGLIGIEARRHFDLITLFGRTRVGVAYQQKDRLNTVTGLETFDDTILEQVELAIGFEINHHLSDGTLIYLRGAAEWHAWMNVTSDFHSPPANPESVWQGHSDAGWAMAGASLGIVY